MQKYIRPILFVILAIMSIAVSSCSKDDDENKTSENSNVEGVMEDDDNCYLKFTSSPNGGLAVCGFKDSCAGHVINGDTIKSVVIPARVLIDGCTCKVTSIRSKAFQSYSSLTSVTIPNTVTTIGDYAFMGCENLNSISLPNSVTSIGDYAFAGCSNLTNVSIPSSVTSISATSFDGCSHADVVLDYNPQNIPVVDGNVYANVHSFTLSENFYTYFETGSIAGYSYVNLGLPSGLKWATLNVGAGSLFQCGDYFRWGETTSFSERNYTEYSSDDFGNSLSLAHDAAAAKWRSSWRMPTQKELQELYDGCNWQWIDSFMGNVSGYVGTSKTNGKQIFLPAAGYIDSYYHSIVDKEYYGAIWSSESEYDVGYSATMLYFQSEWIYLTYKSKSAASSIRAVSE